MQRVLRRSQAVKDEVACHPEAAFAFENWSPCVFTVLLKLRKRPLQMLLG
jgi:hypothetical protein